MANMHYIGFDIHKKTIAFCEKEAELKVAHPAMLKALAAAKHKMIVLMLKE